MGSGLLLLQSRVRLDASLIFLRHQDSVSPNAENPTEPAAALQRRENEVTRQMGWGRGGKMGEQQVHLRR